MSANNLTDREKALILGVLHTSIPTVLNILAAAGGGDVTAHLDATYCAVSNMPQLGIDTLISEYVGFVPELDAVHDALPEGSKAELRKADEKLVTNLTKLTN